MKDFLKLFKVICDTIIVRMVVVVYLNKRCKFYTTWLVYKLQQNITGRQLVILETLANIPMPSNSL